MIYPCKTVPVKQRICLAVHCASFVLSSSAPVVRIFIIQGCLEKSLRVWQLSKKEVFPLLCLCVNLNCYTLHITGFWLTSDLTFGQICTWMLGLLVLMIWDVRKHLSQHTLFFCRRWVWVYGCFTYVWQFELLTHKPVGHSESSSSIIQLACSSVYVVVSFSAEFLVFWEGTWMV